MKRLWMVAAAVLTLTVSLIAAEEPVKESPPNGNEMPLPLYQKLKGHFDGLYGAKAGLLPGVQTRIRARSRAR